MLKHSNEITLAHEIGHLLLAESHSSDTNNLMAEGQGNGKNLITEEQCEKARERARKFYLPKSLAELKTRNQSSRSKSAEQ